MAVKGGMRALDAETEIQDQPKKLYRIPLTRLLFDSNLVSMTDMVGERNRWVMRRNYGFGEDLGLSPTVEVLADAKADVAA